MQPENLRTESIFLNSKLKTLKLVTLYLLSTGRNAWHSTWSEKYRPDTALFSSFEGAKAAAENARNRGTTFEIEQFPGLAFFSSEGVVALVEFQSKPPFKKLKFENLKDHLRIGTPIRNSIAPFIEATSEFWETPFPSDNSFVGVKSDILEEFEEIFEDSYLKKWGSVSAGSNYYLVWHEKGQPEVQPIMRVMSIFKEINEFEEIITQESELGILRELAADKEKKRLRHLELSENLHASIREYLDDRNDEARKQEEEEE